MTQFITLAGRKQVGKDSSAFIISCFLRGLHDIVFDGENVGKIGCATATGWGTNNVHIVHFADALKQACHVIFGIPLKDMETEEGKQKLTKIAWPLDESGCYEGLGGPPDNAMWTPYNGQPPGPKFMTVREVLQFVGTELFRNQLDPDIWLNSVFLKPWAEDDIVIIADARFPNEAALGRENGLLIRIERDTGLVSDGHKSENALADYTDYHYTVDNNDDFNTLGEKLNVVLKANSLLV